MLQNKNFYLFLLLILSISSNAIAQKYVQISTERQTDSKNIVVYEFFWYGCPHCFNLEPTINRLEADAQNDTEIIKIPVALRNSWLPHAKLFYALKQMNKVDELHDLIFEEIHLENNPLNTSQQMIDFLGKNGVDTKKFIEHYESFGTEARVKKADRLARQYQINSVPTIIVNGKYLTSGSYVTSYDELYSVINLLVDRERNDL